MAFALFIVYLILTFVRPGEQDASFRGWELMDVASGLALLATAFAVLMGRGSSFRAVQIPLALAFATWALVSVVATPNRSDIALEDLLGFIKGSCTAFLLAVFNVDTTRRLRIVAVVLTCLGLFVVGQGVLAYHFGVGGSQFLVGTPGMLDSPLEWDDPAKPPPADPSDEGARSGAPGEVARIRGLGFLNDPNDLACSLVSILPLCLALRRNRAHLRNAILWISAGAIVYGIYLTRSRGGILALAGVFALSVRHRLGRALSILAGAGALLALIAMGFLGGRSMSIDPSARGRIEQWSDGLQMLKSSPVWGVGFGMFTETSGMAAHSCFIHCLAELGLVGYFLWLSLIMLTLDDLRSLSREKGKDTTELRRWAEALGLSLIGFLIGGLFLSRSYDVLLFILLGLGAATTDLARRSGYLSGSRSIVRWLYLVIAVELVSIISFWLYMRLLR